jgi:hypothetical protein
MVRRGSRATSQTFTISLRQAGYATVVSGEKRTIGDLRSAKQVTHGAYLATRLAEAAVDAMRAVLGQAEKAAA